MSADKPEHLASPAILQKIDKLREHNVGQHVPLPQLVAVGDQSSGKSSLLESLTGIPFPRNLELCTRYATQITSRRDAIPRIEITIIPGPNATDDHRRELLEYQPTVGSTQDLHKDFPLILTEVNRRMGITDSISSSVGRIFSDDVLKIEICGPNEDYLTVIDVPGIFRAPTEGITTREDVKLVQNMVKEYIKHTRTIILAVLPSNVDAATQEILSFAEEYDKSGERTLAVLTKPDLVTERSAKEVVCNLVLGKRRPLTLGYYVVRNRGADDDELFSHASAEQLFNSEPWCNLPKDRVGLLSLKMRLGELLGEITRKEFPSLRNDITKQLNICQKDIEALGPARQMEQEQRLFLSNMAKKFQNVASAALNAQYSTDTMFEEHAELRLITYAVNLAEVFSHDFEKNAHTYYFDDPSKAAPNDKGMQEKRLVIDQARTFTSVIDADDFPMLESLVTIALPTEPEEGIMGWLEGLYIRSRGMDLGVFVGDVLASAVKEQTGKWLDLTKQYIGQMITVVHRFVTKLLEVICVDPNVRNELWAEIQEELMMRYKGAMEHALFLVNVERDQRPYTLNHYYNENLQIARNDRQHQELRPKARREKADSFNSGGNLVIDLNDVKATKSKSNFEQAKEEIHDILKSYYKVARKRFVDNIFSQAIDHYLLTGPTSPLTVLSQEWVIMLDVERLETIAGESAIVKARREVLQKKIKELQKAMQILRR